MLLRNTILIFTLVISGQLLAQDIMMQGWYWDFPKGSWGDTLAQKAPALGAAGFTHVWFPPHAATASGTFSNGYDPSDLFVGTSNTSMGPLSKIVTMCNALNSAGIDPVADMVYNHRDGGLAEINPAVEGWIENFNSASVNAGNAPYPSDRFSCYLTIGGSTGLGVGTYYIKVKSASGHSNFFNKWFKMYSYTLRKGWAGLPDQVESEPNGGGGCAQPNNAIQLGRIMHAGVDAGGGCAHDEFALTLTAADMYNFDALYFTMVNSSGDVSDHYISEIWYNGQNIQSQLSYRTFTNHTNHSSGRGDMTYANFRPNGNPTTLSGDYDGMWFYYDYDHSVPSTRDTLNAWTKWSWDYLGIRGVRMDAVKHFDASYVSNMMSFMSGQGKSLNMAVGEIYSTNVGDYSWWLNNSGGGTRVFDFKLRDNLRKACDEIGSFDTRDIFNGAAAGNGINQYQTVTFLNNHDFRDGSGFSSLAKENRDLAYCYLLTNNQIGIPCVYYPDYYGYQGGQSYFPSYTAPQKPIIDQLINIHKNYVYGSSQIYYLNAHGSPAANYISGQPYKSLIYQIEKGTSDVLVAINFDYSPLDVEINMAVPAGATFNKIGGNTSTPAFTTYPWSGTGRGKFVVPARSFAIWVESSPLPVEWVSFDATQLEKEVSLNWEIAQATQDFSHFVVERSANGTSFEKIGEVAHTSLSRYQFIDKKPDFSFKSQYYRIQSVDHDQKVQYTNIKEVRLSREPLQFVVMPQPTHPDAISVKVDAALEDHYTMTLADMYGRTIYTQPIDLVRGEQMVQLPPVQAAAGLYFLSFQSATGLRNTVVVEIQ
jgi:Alpha amylase, catalytic domain